MKYLLSSTAFLILNKQLARQIGLNAAILLADLISKEEYFINNGMTDSWFFNTESNIEEDTTLNPYTQRKCIKILKEKGFIEVKRKGIPAKQYFKINEEQVLQILNNLSIKNSTTINKNKEIKINNKYISIRQEDFEKSVKKSTNGYGYNIALLDEFISYWTELNKSKTKMKFEMEKTFDIEKRLARWKKNDEKWNKPQTMSKIDIQLNEYQKGKELL